MGINLTKIIKTNLLNLNFRVLLNSYPKNWIKDIQENLKISNQELANLLNIPYSTLWDYTHKSTTIPFNIIQKLEIISKETIFIQDLRFNYPQNKTEVKIPTILDENLGKIIGTIIADGHIKIRKADRGQRYELIIREEYESNIKAFCKWFLTTFEIHLNAKKTKNHYSIYLSNKIVVLFLTRVINLPQGKKSDIIRIPTLIKQSNMNIKLATLKGIFMFDGGVNYANCYICLISKSKFLIQDISKVFSELKINPSYLSKTGDNFNRHRIEFRESLLLNKLYPILFEEKTEKWWRLHEHFYGLNGISNSKELMLNELNKFYHRKRKTALTFSDIIRTVEELGDKANISTITKNLKKGKTVTYEYLIKLTRWKILISTRIGNKKYWKLNNTFYYPRR